MWSKLSEAVCSGSIPLVVAQQAIATDRVTAIDTAGQMCQEQGRDTDAVRIQQQLDDLNHHAGDTRQMSERSYRIIGHFPVILSILTVVDQRKLANACRAARARYPVGRSRVAMAIRATVTDLDSRRPAPTRGGLTVCRVVDKFLDAPKIAGNPNTVHAYTNVLDRAAAELGPDRPLAAVADDRRKRQQRRHVLRPSVRDGPGDPERQRNLPEGQVVR
jgi:hypothetical protein